MVIMILSEKLRDVTSVSTPLTLPVTRLEGAGKASSLISKLDISLNNTRETGYTAISFS
jgi:hypothetical protein